MYKGAIGAKYPGSKSSSLEVLGKRIKARRKYTELVGKLAAFASAALVIVLTLTMIYFIGEKGLATFTTNGVSVIDFLFSTQWQPDRTLAEGGPAIGSLSFILGSLLVSLMAVAVSAPLSVIVAIFMVEIAPGPGPEMKPKRLPEEIIQALKE